MRGFGGNYVINYIIISNNLKKIILQKKELLDFVNKRIELILFIKHVVSLKS